MPKLLYSATRADGSTVQAFVDAPDAASARVQLVGAGLTSIQFHQEASIAQDPSELKGLTAAQAEQLARFKLEIMRNPGLVTVLKESVRRLRVGLFIDAVLLCWGLWSGSWLIVAAAVFFAVSPFVMVVWRHRHADRYQELIKAYSMGDWARVEHLAGQLRTATHLAANLEFDLDVRLASIAAHRGQLASALAGLEPWRRRMTDSAALCECRIASVCAAGGDREGFVGGMDRAYKLSGNDASRALDLALAHARVGDLKSAQTLLATLDEKLLPAHGIGFLLWARGLCQFRSGDANAIETLTQAVAEFMRLSNTPAVWTALSFCVGDHALALAAGGQKDQARREIADVWPVLGAHADKPYRAQFELAGLIPA